MLVLSSPTVGGLSTPGPAAFRPRPIRGESSTVSSPHKTLTMQSAFGSWSLPAQSGYREKAVSCSSEGTIGSETAECFPELLVLLCRSCVDQDALLSHQRGCQRPQSIELRPFQPLATPRPWACHQMRYFQGPRLQIPMGAKPPHAFNSRQAHSPRIPAIKVVCGLGV